MLSVRCSAAAVLALLGLASSLQPARADVITETFGSPGNCGFSSPFHHSYPPNACVSVAPWFGPETCALSLCNLNAVDTVTVDLPPGSVARWASVLCEDHCGVGCSGMRVFGTTATFERLNSSAGGQTFSSQGADVGEVLSVQIFSFEGFFDDLTIGFDPPAVCTVDLNNSGTADVPDLFAFLSLWFANDPAADFDHSGLPVAVPDIFAFLSAWFAGCP